jgi:hypothetical protein
MTLWWIVLAVYISVGAIVAGITLGVTGRSFEEESSIRVCLLCSLWPAFIVAFIVMALFGKRN